MSGKTYQLFKRILDIIISIIVFILILPINIIIFTVLFIQLKHYPIFKQQRVGKNNSIFYIYKFQTMVDDAETILNKFPNETKKEYYNNYKLDNDPRVTKIGRVLRRFSLDELPQIFNVIKGEMSLIGPRPVVPKELKKYGARATKLLTIRPGMTGLWQVNGHNYLTYNQRIELDMIYIDSLSFKLDLKIFFKTIIVIFKKRGSK